MAHEFIIVASGLDPSADDYETRFYDGPCSDATVSYQRGLTIIEFARSASSFEEAVTSAIRDVCSLGASVERVEPDPLVSLSDVAARSGLSRSAISQYANGQRRDSTFPTPAAKVTSQTPLWSWAVTARWLYGNAQIPREQVVEAIVVERVNRSISYSHTPSTGELRYQILNGLKEFEVL